jgi:hypothetical protein
MQVLDRSNEGLSINVPFDYSSLPTATSKFLKGQADRIRRYVGKSIVDIGRDLAGAKHYLSHGEFLRWVESEVGIPARTAQAYMQVAHWVAGKSATIALLPPSLLYVLSSPSTPKDFIEKIVKRAETGECMALSTIREELKALRQPRQCGQKSAAQNERSCVAISHTSPTVMDAVAIMAEGLSTTDFDRVRNIMTSKRVLDDPEFPRLIATAFLNADSNGQCRNAEASLVISKTKHLSTGSVTVAPTAGENAGV